MSGAEVPVILAVDDEPLVLDLIKSALEDAGFGVETAGSGEEAVLVLDGKSQLLGGLVVDVNLGAGMKGWEVARRARELNPNLPVVYVTGDSAQEWPAEGVPRSALVLKPFAGGEIPVALASQRQVRDTAD